MHPALSVIVFTVSSGAGYGLLMLTVLLALTPLGGELPAAVTLSAGIIALILITVGLLASTQHLANPRNAWRAFSRFRSSWLSREAVFAVLLYPFALLWLASAGWFGRSHWLIDVLGLLSALLALITVLCTGMIYACLRTIRQWHNPLVPVNYLLLGLSNGALLLVTILAWHQTPTLGSAVGLSLALVAATAITKGLYYYWIGLPQSSTLNTGLGITRARVRLFESGESSGNFLTREFGFRPDAALLRKLRLAVYLLAFAVPLVLLLLPGPVTPALATAAAVAMLVGTAIERWLFFAEARHVVNLFYGRTGL